jgi:hypothetical protein
VTIELRELPPPLGFEDWWQKETSMLKVDATHRMVARMAWRAASEYAVDMLREFVFLETCKSPQKTGTENISETPLDNRGVV